MSCYVVSDLTISAIVAAMADTDFEPASLKDEESGVKYNPATCGQIVGQMLLDANYASVNEYYGKHTRAHEFKLTQKQDGKPFTLGEKYGCIECYEYQACQQPGYDNSEIHGEAVSKHMQKGDKIAIEGKLRFTQWEKEGQHRTKLEVVIEDIEFMAQRRDQ